MTTKIPIPKSSDCPLDPESFITAYLAGKLPQDEAMYLEKHLQNCTSCSELRRELRIRHSLNEIEIELHTDKKGKQSQFSPDTADTEAKTLIQSQNAEDSATNPAPIKKESTLPPKPQSVKYTVGGRPDLLINAPSQEIVKQSRRRSLKNFFFKWVINTSGKPLTEIERIKKWSIIFLFSIIPILAFQFWPTVPLIKPSSKKPSKRSLNYFESQLRGEFRRNSNFSTIRPMLNGETGPVVSFSWQDNRKKDKRTSLTLKIFTNGEVILQAYRGVTPPLVHSQSLTSGLYYWTLEDDSKLLLVSKFIVL